jgi:putative addiction module CopG family antidote
MDVLLNPELEKFVAEKVRTGQFADVSDLVNEAVRSLKELEEFGAAEEEVYRREILRGLEQLDRGEHSAFTAESIIAEERARLANGKGGN